MNKKILIHITEQILNNAICKFLSKKSYEVLNSKSLDNFKDILKDSSKNINVIILDDKDVTIEFINDISNKFNILIVFISNIDLKTKENILKVEKPINLLNLESLISSYLNKININTFNYIKSFIQENLSNEDCLFSIIKLSDKSLGLIYIKNKTIIHAEYSDLIGEEAWEEILKIEDGIMAYYKEIKTPLITCNIPFELEKQEKINKVAIIISDETLSSIIKNIMESNGFTCENIKSLSEIQITENYSFIIIDDSIENLELKENKKYKNSYFLFLGKKNINLTNIQYKNFSKPLQIKEFESFIEFKLKELKYQNFTNKYIKEIVLNKLEKEIEIKRCLIKSVNTNIKSLVYILNNKIIHSEFNDIYGEDAFDKIMFLENIEFIETNWKDPIIKTLDININDIIPEINNISIINKRKVLILDDDITTSKILSKILSKNNFDVVESNSIESATEIIKKDKFNLVISDINIPNGNGLKFLLWIKNTLPETNVIMISSFYSEQIKNFAYEHGAISFFEKPIDIEKLLKFFEIIISYNSIETKSFSLILKNKYSDKKNVLGIFEPISNTKGLIIIENENVVYSQYGHIIGYEAFFEILKKKNILFRELDNSISLQSNTNRPLIDLINEFYDSQSSLNSDKKIKILIVDDDLASVKILSRFLNSKGFDTKISNSAILGEQILINENFDLVITDLNMPEVNGLDFLIWIKQYFPETKVIIMTAFNSDLVKEYSNQKGAFYYFEKPLDLSELEKLIKYSFFHKIQDKDVTFEDFIKIALLTNKNRIITINDINSENKSFIYIKNRKIIHAEYKNIYGVDALNEIFKNKIGIFSEISWKDPNKNTLNYDINDLVSIYLNKNNNIEINPNQNIIDSELKLLNEISEIIKNEQDPIKKLTIYEEGVALEIILGKTTKEEAIQIMKKYSVENFSTKTISQILMYQDLSLSILFNENSIVSEMRFGNIYKGSTKKGIKIGDELKSAFEIYGKPNIFTLKGAIWNKLSLFSLDGRYITSIRIRKN